MAMTTNLTYHIAGGRLIGTAAGKPVSGQVHLLIDSPARLQTGQYQISPPKTSPVLGLHVLVSAIHTQGCTIDFLVSPARSALADCTIDFLRSPAGNALAGGSTGTFVMYGSIELMQAFAASAGGLLRIVA
jgi:hypothetical protein